ncbi:hypothetical protein ACH4GE_24410 [Streptomyces tendae]|uniref:hypothetical protein n=1 Tax=Streptomyces tendae TaxID=1932 RepID=UPI00378C4830
MAAFDVQRAVARYEVASARYKELTGLGRPMSGAEFDSLALAQDTMADSVRVLTAAGRLDLIGGAS